MATLTEHVKHFIVEHLACYDTPQQVADAVKEEFDLSIDRRQVEEYDPSKRCRTKKWIDLHASTRKAFLEERASLAITHRAWRQRELQDMVRRAKKNRNYKLAAELLEQAAKEEGGMFTNRQATPASTLSDEDLTARMRAQFDAMDDRTAGASPSASAPIPSAPAATTLAVVRSA